MDRTPPYAILPSGAIIPDWAKQKPGEYRPIPRGDKSRAPSIWLPVWIEGNFREHRDSEGVRLVDRMIEGLLNIGCVASIGFKLVSRDQAQIRFHYAARRYIMYYSYTWKNYKGGWASGLFAVSPRQQQPTMYGGLPRVDVYSGSRGKIIFGARPHGPIQAIRIPWHGIITHGFGWYPEQSTNSPIYAMRNPNMSGPISTNWARRKTHGVGGFDIHEMARWMAVGRQGVRVPGQPHGHAWIRRG